MQRLFRCFLLTSFLVYISPLLAVSQGIQQSPYSAADAVTRGSPSIAPGMLPANPLGLPGSSAVGQRGSDSISISSGMFQGILPKIPNLQLGYEYTFGPKFRAGTASVDYLLPFKLEAGSTMYGEAHGEFQSLSIAQPGSPNNSVELCFGGGYRRMFGNHTLVGIHSFFDTTKLSGVWYPSGSVGVEMAALVGGHDAIDLIFNWYGQALDASSLNSLGYVPGSGEDGFGNSNFDFQVGYSHELYSGGPDLRLSLTGYKFDMDSDVYGCYAGAELKSRNGMFVVKYDVGRDNVNQAYQAVGAFANIGFQLENLLSGKSPFVMPKPVFQGPRNLTALTEAKVKRNWRRTTQTAGTALLAATPDDPYRRTVTIWNKTGQPQTLYVKFSVGELGSYTVQGLADNNPGWTVDPSDSSGLVLKSKTLVPDQQSLSLVFDKPHGGLVHFVMTVGTTTAPTCKLTQAEITLQNNFGTPANPDFHEGSDISLVNGFDYPVTIVAPYSQSQDLKPKVNPTDPDVFYGPTTQATAATGNSTNYGVFGIGNDQCCASCALPGGCCSQWSVGLIKSESHPAKTTPVQCPASPPPATCNPGDPCFTYPCGGVQCQPTIPCSTNYWQTYATGTVWTVTFNKP